MNIVEQAHILHVLAPAAAMAYMGLRFVVSVLWEV
jgi:hypothetical protein